jgi:hypothetical protein
MVSNGTPLALAWPWEAGTSRAIKGGYQSGVVGCVNLIAITHFGEVASLCHVHVFRFWVVCTLRWLDKM